MAEFEVRDIAYREVDGVSLLGRLYRPRGTDPCPLLVDVHGGAWISGDRLNNAVIHEALAAEGIGVFAIDFRMPPAARYPAAVQDVNFAIRWARRNAAQLGTTAELIGGMGTSSGGHLLALNALRPEDEAWRAGVEQAPDATLACMVACWPILDPLARLVMARQKNLANLISAHAAFWPDEASMAYANPQLIVERGECQSKPRLLVLQGTADANVEPARASSFAQRYRGAGGDVTLHMFDGEPHAFMLNKPAPAFAEAFALIRTFVRQSLPAQR
ncbi:MAG: alpha/beta hydrolase [Burkholderiales bacterium]